MQFISEATPVLPLNVLWLPNAWSTRSSSKTGKEYSRVPQLHGHPAGRRKTLSAFFSSSHC